MHVLELNSEAIVVSAQLDESSLSSSASLSGNSFFDLVIDRDKDRFNRFFNGILTGNHQASLECTLVLQKIPIEVICVGYENGGSIHLIIHEITHYKRALERLEATKSRIRSFFEYVPMGIVIANSSTGVIEAVNPMIETMFGFPARDLLQQHIVFLFQSSEEREPASFLQFVNKSLNNACTIYGARSNGEVFPVDVFVRNFSEQSEDKLLICMVDASAREELERLKREFMMMVSHDIRTPLTSIGCFFEAVSKGIYAEDQLVGRAKTLQSESQRLINLVSSLLDLDKLEARKTLIEKAKVPVEHVFWGAAESVRALAERKELSLSVNAIDQFAWLDQSQIMQVLINLLSNAIKFSPVGTEISLGAIELDTEIEMFVCDQGPGIPFELREKIFDRYEQVGQSKFGSKEHGSGLGLAICKAIVTAHGGTIGVDSKEGEGSRFWFRIPIE